MKILDKRIFKEDLKKSRKRDFLNQMFNMRNMWKIASRIFQFSLKNLLTEFLLTQIALPYPKEKNMENPIFLAEYRK